MKIATGGTGNTDRYTGGKPVREMDKETDTEKETCVPEFEGKLITEAVARKLASGSKKKFALAKGVILTPSAKEQPAPSAGINTFLLGEMMDAVSAMKCTPQKTIISASVVPAIWESPRESPK
jgi:ABC-type Na+ transport system ATPase subunit NatA